MIMDDNRPLRIKVLGPLDIDRTDGPVRLSGRKQRTLLAALLVLEPRAVSAQRLADTLWPDELPADPYASLQVHMSRLRGAIGAGDDDRLIVTEAPGYRLDGSRIELDARRFEELVNAARRTSDPEAGLADLDEALDLWRGAAYAEFAERSFARGEAARLEELRFAARELTAELLSELNRFDEAASVLDTVIAADPLRERPRALLARALYRLGRQGDALAVCREFRRLANEELGLDPSPIMEQLEQRILSHELDGPPTRSATRRAESGAAQPPAGPPLEIRYIETGGRRIAVGEAGSGPTLVTLPGFVSNLTTISGGQDPRSRLLAVLADSFRIVTYDRYGTGLSPGEVDDYSVPASARELEGLLDELDRPAVAVLAISCAGPVAATVAARRPDRVSQLVFLGTYIDADSTFGDPAVTASVCSLVRAHWGLGSKLLMDLMYPSASPEFVRLFARGQRDAAPVEVAARYLEAMFKADASEVLADIAAPSLVIHYTGDRAIPFRGGRDLAASLSDARMVPLGGSLHLPEGEDAERVAQLIRDFVTA
jgi:DNA-binding SARP family transcriptional activator/pimeloyl-ACP methyl ester carboxylesterase